MTPSTTPRHFGNLLRAALLGAAFLAISPPVFAQTTWTGGDVFSSTTGWADALNWNNGAPTNGNPIFFDGSTGLTNGNDIGSLSVSGLTFNSTAGAFVLGGTTFTTTGAITDLSATNTETMNVGITLGANPINFNVASGGSLVVNGPIGGTGDGLTKIGNGILTLTGCATSASNTYTGATTVNRGTLKLDYSASGAPATNIISSSSILTMGGGTLLVNGAASGTSAQTFASTTFNAGASTISAVSGASNTLNLTLGAMTRNTGSMENFILPATGSIAATVTANSLLGSGAFVTNSNGSMDLAAGNGAGTGITGGLSTTVAYTTNAAALPATTVVHFTNTAAATTSSITTNRTLGMLLFDTSNGSTGWSFSFGGSTMSVTNVLETPAVGAGNVTITGTGTFRNGSGAGTIYFGQYNTGGFLNITGPIGQGSSAQPLVQAGNSTLALMAVNTFTGQLYLNGGVTLIQADSGLGAVATGAQINMNGGTVVSNTSITLDNGGSNAHPFVLNANNGGGLGTTTGHTLVVDGAISGAGALTIGIPASANNGSTLGQIPGTGTGTVQSSLLANGIVSLTGTGNSYTGGTVLASGTLNFVNGSLGSGGVTLNGGTLQWATGASTDISTGNVVTVGANGGTLDVNGNSITLGTGNITGAGALTVKSTGANGKLTLGGANTNSGGVTISSGTLALTNVSGSATGSGAVGISGGATLTGAGSASGTVTNNSGGIIQPGTVTAGSAGTGFLTTGALTLNSGSVVDFGLNASSPTNNYITTAGVLTLPLTGTVTINLYTPGTSTAFAAAGTYDLLGYGSLVNGGTPNAEFTIGTPITGFSSSIAATGGFIVLTLTSSGVVGTWTDASGSDNNWSTTGNWLGSLVPSLAGSSATFDGTHATPGTVNLDANESVGGLTFSASGYTISGANTLTFDNSGSGAALSASASGTDIISTPVALNDNLEIVSASGNTLTLSNSITNSSGSKTITVNGPGTVVLSGTNSYGPSAGSVGTTLEGGGTAQAGSNSAFGAGDVSAAASTTLQAGAATVTLPNNIILGNGVTETLDSNGDTLTLNGVISDTSSNGAINKIGSGTVVLGNTNTYHGTTTITAGTLSISADANLGTDPASTTANSITFPSTGDLLITGTTTLPANRGIAIGATTGSTGGTGQIDVSSGQTATVSGVIGSNGNTGANGLNVNSNGGTGTLVLGAANTITGTTTLGGGTLELDNSSALTSSTLNYGAGTLNFGSSITTATLAGLSGASGSQNLALQNLAGTPAAVALTIAGSSSNSYAGELTGPGSFTKTGTGTQTFTGTSNFAGAVTLSGPVVIAGGTFGSSTSNFEVGNGVGLAGPMLSVTAGTLNAHNVLIADLGGSTGDNVAITGSGSAVFASSQVGSSTNTGGNLTINTSGTVNLGAYAMGRDGSTTNAGPLLTGGLVIKGGSVTATSILPGSGVAGRSSDINLSGGSLTVGSTTPGAFGLGTGTGTGFLTMTGGQLTYLGSDGLLVGSAGSVTINGATANVSLSGVTLNSQNSGTTALSNLTIDTGAKMYIGSVGLAANVATASVFYSFGTATIGATAPWTSSAPIGLTGVTSFQAADASDGRQDITLSGALSGAGALTKTGSGILTLANPTYTGATIIGEGTLKITSSTVGTSSVTLGDAPGTLSGANTGSSILHLPNLTWNPGSTILAELTGSGTGGGAISTGDSYDLTGALTFGSSGSYFFDFSGSSFSGSGPWTISLISYASESGYTGGLTAENLPGGYTGGFGSLDPSGGTLTFTVSAVPEPGVYALVLGGVALLAGLRRRKNSRTSTSNFYPHDQDIQPHSSSASEIL